MRWVAEAELVVPALVQVQDSWLLVAAGALQKWFVNTGVDNGEEGVY